MDYVYLVFSGQYEDWDVESVHSTLEDAFRSILHTEHPALANPIVIQKWKMNSVLAKGVFTAVATWVESRDTYRYKIIRADKKARELWKKMYEEDQLRYR